MTSTPQNPAPPSVVLIAGHWLGAWAWDQVIEHLTSAGVQALALTLPGLDEHDPRRASRTLDEQVAAMARDCRSG